MSAGHAFLAPSSAHRWRRCPGSALMESLCPDLSNKQAAAEGTAVHWVMEQMLSGIDHTSLLLLGRSAPNGILITDEMIDAADMFCRDVITTLGPSWPKLAEVERPVQIPRVHPTQNWGTPDVKAWLDERHLCIWDLKYGKGIVEVFENDQLVDYAAGCLTEHNERRAAAGLPAISEGEVEVVFTIVQPRAYHIDGPIRRWAATATRLRDHIFALSMAADEATGKNPPCKPDPVACEDCSARGKCEALQRAIYRGMDMAGRAMSIDMPPAALGLEARMLSDAIKLMEARKSGLDQQIESMIRSGQQVPHWHMAPSKGREVWQDGKDREVIALGQMYGIDVAKPTEAITPVQAKNKGLPAEIVSAYSVRPSGNMKLVIDDGSAARKVFANGA